MNFEALQLVLAAWPEQPFELSPSDDPVLARLARVLADPAGWTADLLPLLRHALTRESARRSQPVALRVPRAAPWPSVEVYARHSLRVVRADDQNLLVEARPWQPQWLGHETTNDIFSDAFAEVPSRAEHSRPMEPLLQKATGFSAYTSPGQRAAVHAVLMAKARSTLVVTLPTGSGKSLVAQASSLLAGEGACTVVVVPTIALALDQARQFAHLWTQRYPRSNVSAFAWHAGVPDPEKQQIKHALRSGKQPIVFTSPESVVGTLRMAIHDAAQRGYLKYLVIDEAHLVAQWGDSFRPEFQSLAAFRRALLQVAPVDGFKTVLMTATLTAEALSTIETLFTDGTPVELIASVHLRSEPRYWFAKAVSRDDQEIKVLDVVRHAPRPLILYATEVRRAREWAQLLRAQGHTRLGLFHGETGNIERQRLVDAWAADEIDIMVATSAFGVGIDKRDVRCVLHACVPESLDRFYQEVGRGGRDGRASAAVTVFTDADLKTAQGIAAPSLITVGLGLPRWNAMMKAHESVAEGVCRIDLATIPPQAYQATDYNRAWNLRTVMLLVRAGVVELASQSSELPRPQAQEIAQESNEEDLRRMFDSVLVRVRDGDHLSETLWTTRVEHSRQATLEVARAGLQRMERVLTGQAEISRELQALYTLSQPGRLVLVAATCSGCPLCRAIRRDGIQTFPALPLVRPLQNCDCSALQRWRDRFPALAGSPVLILFDPSDPLLERRLEQLALRLHQCGMREMHTCRDDWPSLVRWQVLHQPSNSFVALTGIAERDDELATVPRLTLLRRADPVLLGRLIAGTRPFDWIVVPSNTPDPDRPDRRLTDVRECVRLPAALEILNAWVS